MSGCARPREGWSKSAICTFARRPGRPAITGGSKPTSCADGTGQRRKGCAEFAHPLPLPTPGSAQRHGKDVDRFYTLSWRRTREAADGPWKGLSDGYTLRVGAAESDALWIRSAEHPPPILPPPVRFRADWGSSRRIVNGASSRASVRHGGAPWRPILPAQVKMAIAGRPPGVRLDTATVWNSRTHVSD